MKKFTEAELEIIQLDESDVIIVSGQQVTCADQHNTCDEYEE